MNYLVPNPIRTCGLTVYAILSNSCVHVGVFHERERR